MLQTYLKQTKKKKSAVVNQNTIIIRDDNERSRREWKIDIMRLWSNERTHSTSVNRVAMNVCLRGRNGKQIVDNCGRHNALDASKDEACGGRTKWYRNSVISTPAGTKTRGRFQIWCVPFYKSSYSMHYQKPIFDWWAKAFPRQIKLHGCFARISDRHTKP